VRLAMLLGSLRAAARSCRRFFCISSQSAWGKSGCSMILAMSCRASGSLSLRPLTVTEAPSRLAPAFSETPSLRAAAESSEAVMPAAPSLSMSMVALARPGLPAGSVQLPALKATLT